MQWFKKLFRGPQQCVEYDKRFIVDDHKLTWWDAAGKKWFLDLTASKSPAGKAYFLDGKLYALTDIPRNAAMRDIFNAESAYLDHFTADKGFPSLSHDDKYALIINKATISIIVNTKQSYDNFHLVKEIVIASLPH